MMHKYSKKQQQPASPRQPLSAIQMDAAELKSVRSRIFDTSERTQVLTDEVTPISVALIDQIALRVQDTVYVLYYCNASYYYVPGGWSSRGAHYELGAHRSAGGANRSPASRRFIGKLSTRTDVTSATREKGSHCIVNSLWLIYQNYL